MASTPPASPRRRQAAATQGPVEAGTPASTGRMREVRLQVGRVTLALLAALMLVVVVLALL